MSVPQPDITLGDLFGSSRISKTPISDRCPNFYQITPMTKIGSKPWSSISGTILQSSESSALTRSRLNRFQFLRTLPRCSCIETMGALTTWVSDGDRKHNTVQYAKEKDNDQCFRFLCCRPRTSQEILGVVSRFRHSADGPWRCMRR